MRVFADENRSDFHFVKFVRRGFVPFVGVSFSPNFSRAGYQKKAVFLEPVVETCQRGKFW